MNLSTSTRGSMKTRSTSDKRSKDEQGTNEPWEVYLEQRTKERDEYQAGLPTQPLKFGRILFTVKSCGTKAEEEGS